jgi:hypothetical protein
MVVWIHELRGVLRRYRAGALVGLGAALAACGPTRIVGAPPEADTAGADAQSGSGGGATRSPTGGGSAGMATGGAIGVGGNAVRDSGAAGVDASSDLDATRDVRTDVSVSDARSEIGGVLARCQDDSIMTTTSRTVRWLAVKGNTTWLSPRSASLVRITPNGPGTVYNLVPVENRPEVGRFSDDGRFFGTSEYEDLGGGLWAALGARVYRVPDADAAPVLVYSSTIGAGGGDFGVWVPGTSQFATYQGAVLGLVDATDPSVFRPYPTTTPTRQCYIAPRDGRMLCVHSDAPYGADLVDVRQSDLVGAPLIDGIVLVPKWSPLARRIAFCGGQSSSGTLYVFDTANPTAGSIQIGTVHCDDQMNRFEWLNDDWISWLDLNSQYQFLDLTGSSLAPMSVPGVSTLGVRSPGGRCTAYFGTCEGAKGICVQALPPSAVAAVLVAPATWEDLVWSTSGGNLLVGPSPFGEPDLWDLDLSGTPDAGGGGAVSPDLPAQKMFSPVAYDPPVPPRWVTYLGRAVNSDPLVVRFWNRNTRTTFVVGPTGLSPLWGKWSPDGVYYLYGSRDPSYPPSQVPYTLQAVTASAPGASWTIAGINASLGLSSFDVAWQP